MRDNDLKFLADDVERAMSRIVPKEPPRSLNLVLAEVLDANRNLVRVK